MQEHWREYTGRRRRPAQTPGWRFGISPPISRRLFEGQVWPWTTAAWLAETFHWRCSCWCLQMIPSCACWFHPVNHQKISLGVTMLLDPCNSEQKIPLVTESQGFILLSCMWADLLTCKIQYIIISFWVIKETWQIFTVLCNVFSLFRVKPEWEPWLWVFWFISSFFRSYLCFCYTEEKEDPGGTLHSKKEETNYEKETFEDMVCQSFNSHSNETAS